MLFPFLALCLISPSISENLRTISLRPKPKARAGGADDKAAEIFSFAFVAPVYIKDSESLFTLSIGILMENIWVMDSECTNCKESSIQYNTTLSEPSYPATEASYKNSMLNLDAKGTVYEDLITIRDYPTIKSSFVVCSKFVDVLGMAIDGVLGLGTNKSSIVYKMYENKLIDQPIYSLSYLYENYLVLGTPNFLNLSLVIESQDTIKYTNPLVVSKFQFNDYVFDENLNVDFSSISSYITGPFEILEKIYKILASLGCHYEEELLMCECAEEYPNLLFTIQGTTFSISSHEYLIMLGDNCFLGLKSGDHWILGEPLLKAYFFEMNLETSDMTLYKTSRLETELPSPFETTEGWATMISLGIASIALYVIAFLVFLKYEEHKINLNMAENERKRKPRIL